MKEIVTIGFRNVGRRRGRTALTLGMIALGAALIVFGIGIEEGTYKELISLATRTWTGHFQVVRGDYQEKPTLFKGFSGYESIASSLLEDHRVEAVTPRVEAAGLLSLGNRTIGVVATGVDPEGEKKVTTLPNTVTKGEWFSTGSLSGKFPILLGSGVAKRVRASLGDEVSFVGQAADGSIAAELFTVTGIIESGADEMDSSVALLRLSDADELFTLGGRVHRLVGVLHDIESLDGAGDKISFSGGIRFLPWTEVMPQLASTIESDRRGNWIFYAILLLVVVLGVANTMTMAVMERTREFGVMMALGTSPYRLVAIVLCEAAFLSAIGAAIGLGIGALANLAAARWGIPIGSEPISYGGLEISEMHAKNTVLATVLSPALVFFCGVTASLFPALRVARMKPVQAIREG